MLKTYKYGKEKNNKDKPKILLKVGKSDKLIKDYLEVYKRFRGF